jgi:hypothetical protein
MPGKNNNRGRKSLFDRYDFERRSTENESQITTHLPDTIIRRS